jgi:DNA polymerase (family 10)
MFAEIADLLDIKGEDPFKVRAYRRAAEVIAVLPEPIEDYHRDGRLLDIPGIGKALAAKIAEKLESGGSSFLEKLTAELPPGLIELLRIPGVGARTVAVLHRELGVRNLEDLERAALAGRLRHLPRLGEKVERTILEGISKVRSRRGRIPVHAAWAAARDLTRALAATPGVTRVEAAGSLRRFRDTVGDLDLVAASNQPELVMETFTKLAVVDEVLSQGPTKVSVTLDGGLRVDLLVVSPDQFVTALHHLTGSAEHNTQLRHRARNMGIHVSEYGLFREDPSGGDVPKERLPVRDEADLYRHLGLDYVPPELREGAGEIEAAAAGKLAALVDIGDIRGDLHTHTTHSDGLAGIAEMASAARALGYEYIAITDHSRSMAMVHGLDEVRVKEQAALIRRLDTEIEGVRILSGLEVDIRSDGSLDLPDGALAELDVVVASIHSGFRQSGPEITARLVGAAKHEHVDIIGHPTGRLINQREPYPLDADALLEAAARAGTALEINASVERLDLPDTLARRARDFGARLAVSTDAHDQARLAEMVFGVKVARRAGLTAVDIINTRSAADLMSVLKG